MRLGLSYTATVIIFIIVTLLPDVSAIGADLPQAGASSEATHSVLERARVVASTERVDPDHLQTLNSELRVLQAQNELIKQYQSSLLDTVYWALATAVGLLLLIAGGGWFTNFKVFEGEQGRLKEEVLTAQQVLKDEMAASLLEATSGFESRLAANESEIAKMVDQRLDANVARQTRDIDLLRTNLMMSVDDIKKELADLNDKHERLQETDKINWRKTNKTEGALRQVEEYVWDLKGNPYNVLLTQTQGIYSAVLANDASDVKNILDRMKITINKIRATENAIPLSGKSIELIEEALGKAEGIDPIAVSNVRVLLKGLPVSEK